MIPKTVKIGPYEYTVEIVPLLDAPPHIVGQHDPLAQVIRLKEGPNEGYLRSIFCHEIVHALLEVAGMGNDERNEEIATRLESPLYQFLLDNTNYFSE